MISNLRDLSWYARLSRDAGEQISVAEWWNAFGPPIEWLESPATFAEDAKRLTAICRDKGVPYIEGAPDHPPLFPLWLLSEFYPASP